MSCLTVSNALIIRVKKMLINTIDATKTKTKNESGPRIGEALHIASKSNLPERKSKVIQMIKLIYKSN